MSSLGVTESSPTTQGCFLALPSFPPANTHRKLSQSKYVMAGGKSDKKGSMMVYAAVGIWGPSEGGVCVCVCVCESFFIRVSFF